MKNKEIEDNFITFTKEIMGIKKELELLKKENKVLRERVELLEKLVHSDVEFIADFITAVSYTHLTLPTKA